jgi:prepilin-type N-terminal cleavage/methylation domain-containing protein
MDRFYIKKSKRKACHNKGFTLLELVVSIAIIAMITGLFMANFHSSSARSLLIVTAQKLASDIKVAESQALGSQIFGSALPPGGWGIHLDLTANTKFIIFADNDGDGAYTQSEKYKETILPGKIYINGMAQSGGGAVNNPIDIMFIPPDPTIQIKSGATSYNDVVVTLSDSNSTKKVLVNFFGLADVIQ